ncbi:MAG: flagellar basal-body rod protein FlgG [Alphaproteobacteria bacterium]|nr:flagellar basal-body rod protein FlgG [Alphaproteobacteria bacterium]MCZ6593247.1 flagellar basal-body rod protein FlgG [Alphaproteobacteria bacterium]
MRSLSIAATGMLAQQLNVEVISNNIANMNTTGYKRQRAEFQDLLYQTVERVGSTSSDSGTIVPAGVQIGLGVKAAAVYNISEQGSLQSTDNPLDVAISGGGYFQVTLPSGDTAYTRAGSFQLSPTGEIVTVDGYTVAPAITVPINAISVTINKSGQVLVQLPNVVTQSIVGQFQLANFANPAGLDPQGDNLFLETAASGSANTAAPGTSGLGTIEQGFVEQSNVNTVTEITNLITAQRAYEMNSKVIQTSDEMLSTINRLR